MSAKRLTRTELDKMEKDELGLYTDEAWHRLIAHVRAQEEALREIENIVWKGHEGDPLKMIGKIARAARMEE